MDEQAYRIRRAEPCDIPQIRAMHARSMREIAGKHYEARPLEEFLAQIGTMDDAVVHEGHFYVAVDEAGSIVGSGSWSQSASSVSGCDCHIDPEPGSAVIRSVFIDPDHARRGIGKALMLWLERDAVAHGISRLRLTATLSGIPLYEALGYRPDKQRVVQLESGATIRGLDMDKTLKTRALVA